MGIRYNYLDLFSGLGGFCLGALWAGWKWENHFNSDIEVYANKIYSKRFPLSKQLGDINKIDFKALKKRYGPDWVITGGFPCQDISIAGKQKGFFDEKGKRTRSGLWFEMWRAIRDLQPRWVIAENVGMLARNGLGIVLNSLAEIGYDAE